MATVNEEKYRNAILYFARHVRQVGRTKLWKLMYYLDFDHFERYGTSVTGEQYQKWTNGPVPVVGLETVRRMEAMGDIEVNPEPTGLQYPLLKVHALRDYDRSVFSPTEWEMLQAVARKWKFHSAHEMSNATHGEQPWIQAEPNGLLDYALASQRGSEQSEAEAEQQDTEDTDMNTAELALARSRSMAYAKRIERLWDTDPAVRARIARGIAQMRDGRFVPINIDDLPSARRGDDYPS